MFEDEVFYIGVYCERKCNYELLVRLEEEFEIDTGVVYKAFLIKEDTLSFRLKSKSEYQELEIAAFSPKMGFFRLYVKPGERPSSQNTIKPIPSWVGGYSVNVLKDSNDYCTNCYYYIVLESELKEVEVYFFAKYADTITVVRSDEPIFSAIKPFQNHCYKFNIDDDYIKENIIIQTTMFAGIADLKIKMNGVPEMNTFLLSDPFYHEIQSEKVIKVTPEDRKKSNEINKSNTGELIVCLKAYENASYNIKIVFESEIGNFQKYSYLARGREINGYLPKGKATRYRVLEFDSKSDITISMNVKKGDPKLYGYICESLPKCYFDRDRVIKELADNKLILPQEYSIGYALTIKNDINTCHQKMEKNDDVDLSCGTLAIVYCEGDEECEYMLRTTRDDIIHDLQPRMPHYQIIPYNETDYYKFVIEDESVTNVTIILNTISGNADLMLNYMDINSESLIRISQREAYLPDVITISKEKLKKTNLLGTYRISVYGSSFSSYSIYYYTKSENKGDSPKGPSVGITLETGHIIKDIYEPGTDFKVYSYDPNLSNDLDIRITLTPEKDDFYIFVLYDLKNFSFNREQPRSSEGYVWSDNFTNEVIISKTDSNYKRNAVYYIIVTSESPNISNTSYTSSFWIGATTENYPFLLYEGVPNSVTLDDKYTIQTYWYTHPNISDPFSLSLNTYYGRVDVYVDFQEIQNFESKDIAGKELDTDTAYIMIEPEVLKNKCKQINNCGIFIYIKKSSSYDAQYLIVAKSHPGNAEILANGLVRQDTVFAGDFKNYNIITDNKNLNMIYVSFLSGYGELYVNVPKDIQHMKKAKYPTRTEYDYKGSDYYTGKYINIDEEKLPDTCNTCQVLVTVYGKSLIHAQNEIEYSISYYNQARKINQNQPLRGTIEQNEIQYFNVNFGKNVENVYVSLTNINGDIDMYMNYGLEYPNMNNYTWISATLTNEFIEFDKNDNFFVSRNQTDLKGDYTIMLVGLTNSTYTLYITSHPNKIISVTDDQPASCRSDGSEPCYFRYNDFFSFGKNFYDIIITTDYLYGTGSIYANLYKETDYEIINELPSASLSDYSNVESNTRNLLKIKIDKSNKKLTEDSMILISVHCQVKCFFDLNVAKMFDSDLKFIDTNRENLFYIYKSNLKTLLVFYNWSEKNINLNAYTYTGDAKINIYANSTKYDNSLEQYVTDKTDLGIFYLKYENNPSFNQIIENKNESLTYQDIFFEVEPLTDVGFYLKLTYDQEWSKIKINKLNTFTIDKETRKLFIYFDMMDEYENVVVSVKSLNKDVKIYAYIKYASIDKSKHDTEKSTQHDYIIPSNDNYDYMGFTYSLLSQVSIKIPGVPITDNKTKFNRVLISLRAEYDTRIDVNEIKTDILVSPKVNGLSITEAEQSKLIFSVMDKDKKDFTIYDLKKKMPSDDLLVIEISNCYGDVKFKLSNILTSSPDTKFIVHNEEVNAGRKTIMVNLDNYKEEDFYLTLRPKESKNKQCKDENGEYICDSKTETLIYYFTTTKDTYQNSFVMNRGVLTYELYDSDSIFLNWGKILSSINDVVITLNSDYYIFISEDENDFPYMDSICYLSRMSPAENKYKITQNFKTSSIISGLQSKKKYFINVMAKTSSNEILAYRPIEILFESKGVPTYIMFMIGILVIGLIYLIFFFYKKYKLTKKVLEYEVNDVRNMSSIPRTDTEMKNVIKSVENKKYAVLGGNRDESV